MYQTLAGLPNRVVLDANVLLNACFVGGSSARSSISALHRLGFQPIIDQAIEFEAKKVLRRLTIKCALGFDPTIVFDQYLAAEGIFLLPPAAYRDQDKINRADRHVYSAAVEYDSWVLTGDIELMAQCHSLALPSRLPWDVLCEAAIKSKRDIPLHYMLRFAGISKFQGSVFARVIPGSWAGMKDVGIFTICEIENVLSLAYDSSNSSWRISIKGGVEGSLSIPIKGQDHWTIYGGFKISPITKRGTAILRAHSSSGNQNTANFELTCGPSALAPGKVGFGHGVSGTNHWNGYIRSIVVSPSPVGQKTWKALRQNPDSTPDPAAANIVEAALRAAKVYPDGTVFASELDLGKFWI